MVVSVCGCGAPGGVGVCERKHLTTVSAEAVSCSHAVLVSKPVKGNLLPSVRRDTTKTLACSRSGSKHGELPLIQNSGVYGMNCEH